MTDYIIPVPEWLNNEFLQNIVRKYLQEPHAAIKSFKIEPATGKGENFASLMYRVKIMYSGSEQGENFIVKVPYGSGWSCDLLDQMNAYDKELEMYETILPRLTKLLHLNNVDEELFASTIYVSHSKRAIVFEDLSVKGYRMAERNNGLDMHHTRMVLRKLAVFHAGNAVLQEQDPRIFDNFKHGKIHLIFNETKMFIETPLGMLNRRNCVFQGYYITALSALADLVATWPNCTQITNKLRALQSNLLENGMKAFDARPNQFNTLIHGDLWMNNTMYRYNSAKELENAKMVDYQFSCWSSPTIDLHYLMNTSLKEEFRFERQDELVQYYHSVLVKYLNIFNYRQHIPTLHEFQIDFLTSMFYGFISACLILPIVLNENSEEIDLETLHGNNERSTQFKRMMFSNQKIQKYLKIVLPFYDQKGILD